MDQVFSTNQEQEVFFPNISDHKFDAHHWNKIGEDIIKTEWIADGVDIAGKEDFTCHIKLEAPDLEGSVSYDDATIINMVQAFSTNQEQEVKQEVFFPNISDNKFEAHHWNKMGEDDIIKTEWIADGVNTAGKEDFTCHIKLEVPDLEGSVSYDDATIKLEMLHEEVELKSEMLSDPGEQSVQEETAKGKLFRNNLGSSKYTCISNIQKPTKTSTGEHRQIHIREKPFKCHLCSYGTVQKYILERHKKTHTGEKPFTCTICNYSCIQKGYLNQHMKTHTGEKPFKCLVCNYASARKRDLELHMKLHTGDKPFQCSVCNYASVRKQHLKLHMKIHTGEKPFACSVCSYASVRNADLVLHMKNHTGEKPFKCSVCDYACKKKSYLELHMTIHTVEKPFKCSVCRYASVKKADLELHMKNHTGNKPFKCNLCNYASIRKLYLEQHMKTHTGEKPFKCSYAIIRKFDLNLRKKSYMAVKRC